MSGDYHDAPGCPHRHGYINRWSLRKHFLMALYRNTPEVFEALLDQTVVAATLESVHFSEVQYPTPAGRVFGRLLYDRRDGLFAGTNWSQASLYHHTDYDLLPAKERIYIGCAIERWGESTIAEI